MIYKHKFVPKSVSNFAYSSVCPSGIQPFSAFVCMFRQTNCPRLCCITTEFESLYSWPSIASCYQLNEIVHGKALKKVNETLHLPDLRWFAASATIDDGQCRRSQSRRPSRSPTLRHLGKGEYFLRLIPIYRAISEPFIAELFSFKNKDQGINQL